MRTAEFGCLLPQCIGQSQRRCPENTLLAVEPRDQVSWLGTLQRTLVAQKHHELTLCSTRTSSQCGRPIAQPICRCLLRVAPIAALIYVQASHSGRRRPHWHGR